MVELIMTLVWTVSAFANNGSSGIGTASIPVTDTIQASSLDGRLAAEDGNIVEIQSKLPLISVSEISEAELSGLQLVPSRLGSTEAFEFTPSFADLKSSNYWIVCDSYPDKCKRLIPLANSALIAEFIGTFFRH